MWSKNGLIGERLRAAGIETTPLLMEAIEVLTYSTAGAEEHHLKVIRSK